MPRIRSLKPEVASDVKLATVSIEARYTFVLLITQSDDTGLVAGNHRQLLGALYPHDDEITGADLVTWLEELVSIGLVAWRQTRDGAPVLQLVNWCKHQRIDNAGFSQLGALLAESPAENSQTVAEVRGDSPQVAESRGYDLRPTTNEIRPTITDQWRVGLCVAANKGLAEHPSKPQLIPRIIPTSGNALVAVQMIQAGNVPYDFAERAVHELAKSHTSDSEIRSLKYFAAAILRKWEESQVTKLVRVSSAADDEAGSEFEKVRAIVAVGDPRFIDAAQLTSLPERTKSALKAIGGHMAIKRTAPDKMVWLRRDFVQAYSKAGAA